MAKILRRNPKISHLKSHFSRENWRHSVKRCGLLILAGLVLSSGFNLFLFNIVSAEDKNTWTFEEALAARDKYEAQVLAKCQIDTFCELSEYASLVKNNEPDAKAARTMASNSIIVTSMYPETGVIKFFYNDRASTLQNRIQSDTGVSMPLRSINIVWRFKNTDQTYTFTDVNQIIPQQEVEIAPEGLDLPDGAVLDSLNIKIETAGNDTSSNLPSTKRCLSSSDYAPGRECRVQVSGTLGFVHYPIVPPQPEPTPEPDPDPDPEPKPEPEPKPLPDPEPRPEPKPDPDIQPDTDPDSDVKPNPIQPPFITPTLPYPILITPIPSTSTDVSDGELNTSPHPLPDSLASVSPKDNTSQNDRQPSSTTNSVSPSIPLAPNTGRPRIASKSVANGTKLQKSLEKVLTKLSICGKMISV